MLETPFSRLREQSLPSHQHQNLLLLTSILLFTCLPFTVSYSLSEINEDAKTLPWDSLAKYRGPILQNIWMEQLLTLDQDQNHPHDLSSRLQTQDRRICKRLFHKALEVNEIEWPPPKNPPSATLDAYTLGGKSTLQHLWTEQRQNGGEGYLWNTQYFEKLRSKQLFGCGTYAEIYCDEVLQRHRQQFVLNKTAIVVGSQSPWAEASLFNAGASHVTTIEYMNITTDYPNYTTLHPSEVAKKYLDRSWSSVDFAYSYSSLEHDGLGRYGDPLNPYGDFESLARIRCLLRPGGILFLAIPVAPDTVVWNLHRIYGRYRLSLMLLGWKVIEIVPESCDVDDPKLRGNYMCQPLMVLQKPRHRPVSSLPL
jgi:SAM-dependent methyltransferase